MPTPLSADALLARAVAESDVPLMALGDRREFRFTSLETLRFLRDFLLSQVMEIQAAIEEHADKQAEVD